MITTSHNATRSQKGFPQSGPRLILNIRNPRTKATHVSLVLILKLIQFVVGVAFGLFEGLLWHIIFLLPLFLYVLSHKWLYLSRTLFLFSAFPASWFTPCTGYNFLVSFARWQLFYPVLFNKLLKQH